MKISYLSECESTNRHLMQRIADFTEADLPLAIWTDNQTAGRGQRGRSWECPPGEALAASFLYAHQGLSVQQIYNLNKWASLSVCALLEDCMDYLTEGELCIKWPNDILVGGRKVCGILIENLLSGRNVARSVIGIGLNVNQQAFNGDYHRTPTSLALLTNQFLAVERVMVKLAEVLHTNYWRLQNNITAIEAAYRERLFLLNQRHTFQLTHTTVSGRIRDVDAQGRLILETEAGMQYFSHGEIQYPL